MDGTRESANAKQGSSENMTPRSRPVDMMLPSTSLEIHSTPPRAIGQLEAPDLHTYSFDDGRVLCSVSMQKTLGVTDNVP